MQGQAVEIGLGRGGTLDGGVDIALVGVGEVRVQEVELWLPQSLLALGANSNLNIY